MTEEFNLSDKIRKLRKEDEEGIIFESQVKEFIKRLDYEIGGIVRSIPSRQITYKEFLKILHKLAGDKLK